MADFAHSWIGYDNIFVENKTHITTTGSAPGTAPINLGNWQEFQSWRGASGLEEHHIDVDCRGPRVVEYLAMSRHNLGSKNAALTFWGANQSDYSDAVAIFSVTVGDAASLLPDDGSVVVVDKSSYENVPAYENAVITARFPSVSYRYYRLEIHCSQPMISILSAGRRMGFQRGFYGDHSPAKWNEQVEITNTFSETGTILGSSVIRRGSVQQDISLFPVTHDWVHQTWSPFREHANTKPFFLAWEDGVSTGSVLAMRTAWHETKLLNRQYASVGVKFKGKIV